MLDLIIISTSSLVFFFLSIKLLLHITENHLTFYDVDFKKPQAFHSNKILKIGGSIFFLLPLYFFIISNYYSFTIIQFQIIFSSLILLLIGLLSDVNLINNAKFRLFLIIIGVMIIVYVLDYKILLFSSYFNSLILFYIFSFILTSLVFISVINGTNFIDGLNGLALGNSILVFIGFIVIDYKINENANLYIFIIFIVFFISLLTLNYPNAKIFLGDGGAYFIGCLTTSFVMTFYTLDIQYMPLLINLIIYPLSEVSFSFLRKIFQKKSPFKPDRYHLHMLIFNFFQHKLSNMIKANYYSSTIIIFYLIIFYSLVLLFIDNILFQYCLILVHIICYISVYYGFYKNYKE